MKKLGLILLSISAATVLSAADYKYSFTPMVGGTDALSKKLLDNGATLGARLGYNIDKKKTIELGYDFINDLKQKTIPGNPKTNASQLTANYLYHLTSGNKLTPYVLAGIGAEKYNNNLGKLNDGGIFDWGLGVKYLLTKAVALRLEARDIIRFNDGGHTLAYTAGLVFPFGKIAEAAPVAAVKPAAPLDSDHDGVIDSEDKCPNTLSGVAVDANGCAVDSDGDGIPDYKDKCPDSKTKKVNAQGCALDSDNDGVADYLDKCPTTPAGFKVNTQGCAVGFTMHVNFATNSAKIASSQTPDIDKLLSFMKEHPTANVILKGYTDSRGKASYNLALSAKRANAVEAKLISGGILASRITAKGFGEEQPIASNDTKEGRAQNRRVEAQIVPTKR